MPHRDPEQPFVLDPADVELASALGRLNPSRSAIDERSALFEAGRRSGEATARSASRWQGAATRLAVILALAGGLAVVAERLSSPRVVERVIERERIVYRDRPVESSKVGLAQAKDRDAAGSGFPELNAIPHNPTRDSQNLLAMRQKVLEQGIDALPIASGRVSAMRIGDLP